jgi:hypothetical protein
VSAIDYCTGYLMAFGAKVALGKRAQEGGSWLVRISLAQVGKWILDLGEVALNPHDVIAFGQQLTVTKLDVVSAAEGGGRLADIDRYLLTPPGALFPKANFGQSGGCDGRGTGRANSKGRGQYWVGASRECDGVGCLRCPTYDR